MKCPLGSSLMLPLLLCGSILGGCTPGGEDRVSEEKEPYFLDGMARVNAMDYQAAIGFFEKALEVNPRSASAHLELAILYENKEKDPAAAIYHYSRYLRFRPNAQNADIYRGRINSCKQMLAETVSWGPVTERQQRDLEKLVEEGKRLAEENKRLNEEMAKLRATISTLESNALITARTEPRARGGAGAADPSTVGTPSPGLSRAPTVTLASGTSMPPRSPTSTTSRPPVAQSSWTGKTHVVRERETPSAIARQYGVKLESLLAANPGIDPKRIRPGQTLKIP
jgi:tetratricopeptide (TPR) repeat protein